MTCLECATWPALGFAEYLTNMLVFGAISGQVDVASQLREPTMDWKVCVRYACFAGEYVAELILSTGSQDLYGVSGVLMWSWWRPCCWASVSMEMDCDVAILVFIDAMVDAEKIANFTIKININFLSKFLFE